MNFLQATCKQRRKKKPFLAVFRQKEKTRNLTTTARLRVHFYIGVGTLHANVRIFGVLESIFASNAQAILYFYALQIVTYLPRNRNAYGKGGYKLPYITLIAKSIFRLVPRFFVFLEGFACFLQCVVRYL